LGNKLWNKNNSIMETEIWKDILEVGGMYQISNFGRVKSKEKVIERSNGGRPVMPERIMTPSKGNQGYLVIVFRYLNKSVGFGVHRLVATYFIPNPEKCDVVRFIDGDKLNTHYSNLFWFSSGKTKTNKKIPSCYVHFDEISEMWEVVVNKQYFASYNNKERADEILNQELLKGTSYISEEAPIRRNIIPQRANKVLRNVSQFILN